VARSPRSHRKRRAGARPKGAPSSAASKPKSKSGGRRQDAFGKQARREGYAARSVYKLEEMDRRFNLLRRGDHVLDLGAFPGSWTSYAATRVAPEGRVLGLDLTPFKGALPANAEIREGDIYETDLADLGGPAAYDVVLTDMAPSTIGHRFTDVTRSEQLFLRALELAAVLLRRDGRFAGKVFQGGDFPLLRERMRELFEEVKVVKPKATRSESYEVFLVGLRFRSPRG
jgi:23S rRNA (uridine2552-2'-O)-methyltransferase